MVKSKQDRRMQASFERARAIEKVRTAFIEQQSREAFSRAAAQSGPFSPNRIWATFAAFGPMAGSAAYAPAMI